MHFLSVHNLSKTYDTQKVLDRIGFEIEKGTFLSLLGPSGCGKTTILRSIAGFVKPDEGDIYINNKKINEIPAHKRNIGLVFQSYALFPHMTVEQNVAYGLEQRKLSKEEIKKEVLDILEMVQLNGYKKRKPSQLSGGQQQRVALARALVIKPDILLLDESLSALDKKLRVEMQVELRQIQKKTGVTAIFVTHDQEEALTLSDKIAVMQDGKIVQLDVPEKVYEKPINTFVANFLGKANSFEGTIDKKSNYYELKMKNGHTLSFEYEMELNTKDECTVAVRPEKITLSKEKVGLGIEGVIQFITYVGNMSVYRIESLGKILEVQIQNNSNAFNFKTGETVYLDWNKSNTLVLEQ